MIPRGPRTRNITESVVMKIKYWRFDSSMGVLFDFLLIVSMPIDEVAMNIAATSTVPVRAMCFSDMNEDMLSRCFRLRRIVGCCQQRKSFFFSNNSKKKVSRFHLRHKNKNQKCALHEEEHTRQRTIKDAVRLEKMGCLVRIGQSRAKQDVLARRVKNIVGNTAGHMCKG